MPRWKEITRGYLRVGCFKIVYSNPAGGDLGLLSIHLLIRGAVSPNQCVNNEIVVWKQGTDWHVTLKTVRGGSVLFSWFGTEPSWRVSGALSLAINDTLVDFACDKGFRSSSRLWLSLLYSCLPPPNDGDRLKILPLSGSLRSFRILHGDIWCFSVHHHRHPPMASWLHARDQSPLESHWCSPTECGWLGYRL